MEGTRFPIGFMANAGHRNLAGILNLDLDQAVLRFKLHQLGLAHKNRENEPRSDNWNDVFTIFLEESARARNRQKPLQDQVDYAPLKRAYVSQAQVDDTLKRMVQSGVLKYDGTLYRDKDNYIIAKPVPAKPEVAVNLDELSGLDKALIADLKRMYSHHYQQTEKFKWFYSRYTHPNYTFQREADDKIMAELELEPNIGKRICELRRYLQERSAKYFPSLS